jgi:hypothetical protein
MARSRTPDVPLTSLTTTGARSGPSCAACGSDRVTRIAMTLTDGSPVDFAHCLACEHRAWVQDGEVLELPTVLSKAHKQR